jgi:hypothetical protein
MVDGLNRELYRFRPAENTRAKANELASLWARENNFDGNYQVEPAEDTAPALTPDQQQGGLIDVVPGSTTDLARQRATPGTFTGAWKVLDADGNEMHRFSGIGNDQRDANRVATQWVQNNGYAYGTEIEVVPIMSESIAEGADKKYTIKKSYTMSKAGVEKSVWHIMDGDFVVDVTDLRRDAKYYADKWNAAEKESSNASQNPHKRGIAEGKLIESALFLNPTTVVVGQAHGQPLELSPNTLKQIQAIAAKHGAWYEGNGTDRGYTKGQIDRYVGSWDDEVAKTANSNDPKWIYVLFANVDENNRVQRVGIDPNNTIFNRLLATAKDNSYQGIGYTSQALQKFLQMASEGKYDFVKMSQQPATQENLTRFLKAGEALMWPSNWKQYPNKAGKIAKAATVDVRDQYLATRKAGVYVAGSGHLKAVQNITGKQGVAEGLLREFAPSGQGGNNSGRWYTDDELADIIGDDWFEDFDVSHDGFNIDDYGEKAKQNLVGYANTWFDDKGYNVNVLGVEHNEIDHDLKWYIVGSFHNPRFANEGMAEASLATMRDYFAGGNNQTNQKNSPQAHVQKVFRSPEEYTRWAKQNKIVNAPRINEEPEFFDMPLRMSEYRGKTHPATNEPYDSKFKFSGDLKDRVHSLLDAGTKPTLLQVNPRHLLATQDWLSTQGGGKPPFATMKQHPVVLQKDNKLYILDGHHRSADAHKSGTPIQVYLFQDEL